jgi:hypothetical protein
MNALFANIIRGKYEPIPRTFSNDLQQLIARMLTPNPKSRPSINAVLATPIIRRHLDKLAPVRRSVSALEEGARLRRRNEPSDAKRAGSVQKRLLGIGNRRPVNRPTVIAEDTFAEHLSEAPVWAAPKPQPKVVSIDDDTMNPLGASFEERKLQIEKQKADLEEHRRAFQEFGMRSLKEMAELAPPELEPKVTKVRSEPDFVPIDSGSLQLAKSRLSRIHDLVQSVKSGLDGVDDLDDEFGSPNDKPVFVINDVEVSFPVVSDTDSLTYRAEAIRVCLERELGLQKLLDFRDEVDDQHHGRVAKTELSKTLPSGLVVLMWHLVTLDDMIIGM